jgi:hypothetical protein
MFSVLLQTSANLIISGGREMSRGQLSHFKESNIGSKDEDELVDEDGGTGGASRNQRNADDNRDVKSEAFGRRSSNLGIGVLKKAASWGGHLNPLSGRASAPKSGDNKSEGGIKVLHNPRVSLKECF